MSFLHRFFARWARTSASGRVSRECLLHHERHGLTRGVDLPTWRTPKELAQMRRLERRAALRVVGRRA